MPNKQEKAYRSYLLRCWSDQSATSREQGTWYFIVEDISGEQKQQEFQTFEQVMNFLLDEFFGRPEEVRMNDD